MIGLTIFKQCSQISTHGTVEKGQFSIVIHTFYHMFSKKLWYGTVRYVEQNWYDVGRNIDILANFCTVRYRTFFFNFSCENKEICSLITVSTVRTYIDLFDDVFLKKLLFHFNFSVHTILCCPILRVWIILYENIQSFMIKE